MEKARFTSPLGTVELTVSDGKLTAVRLLRPRGSDGRGPEGTRSAAMRRYLRTLDRYFAGKGTGVGPDDLDFGACTAFADRAYRALLGVAFGEVVTYGELARRTGSPGAARAIGQAVGRNPLPIFVPCHRVVAADNGLGGFGAGPAWKAGLLRHEGWSVSEGRIS